MTNLSKLSKQVSCNFYNSFYWVGGFKRVSKNSVIFRLVGFNCDSSILRNVRVRSVKWSFGKLIIKGLAFSKLTFGKLTRMEPCHYLCVGDDDTGAQRGSRPCPRSHGVSTAELVVRDKHVSLRSSHSGPCPSLCTAPAPAALCFHGPRPPSPCPKPQVPSARSASGSVKFQRWSLLP